VDVDPVDLHLIGYGYRGLPADRQVHEVALPRLADLFARCGVRATFFVVGRDAAPHVAALSALARAGHEIASHSFTHPLAFASLGDRGMREELESARAALEAATGRPVVGYRSPNFDMDGHALRVLAECGYRYDASAYPSPLLFPARLLLALKSRDPGAVLRLKPWPTTRQPSRSRMRFQQVSLRKTKVRTRLPRLQRTLCRTSPLRPVETLRTQMRLPSRVLRSPTP